MKTPRNTTRTSIAIGMAVLAFVGCRKGETAKEPPPAPRGNAQSTLSFWEGLHQPYLNSNDVHLFKSMSGGIADLKSEQYLISLFRTLSAGEQERCRRVAGLPVLKVDPDVTAFATQFIDVRQEVAAMLGQLAVVAENPSGLPDAPEAAFGFFLRLLQHSNDGDEAFWNALKEEVVEDAKTVGKTQDRARNLIGGFQVVSAKVAALETQELSLRAKLAQRYGREFPAGSTFPSGTNAPSSATSPSPPTADPDKMMRDLVGRHVGSWTIETGEFQSFDILDGKVLGDLAWYRVKARLRGSFSGKVLDVEMRLSYRNQRDMWALALVENLN